MIGSTRFGYISCGVWAKQCDRLPDQICGRFQFQSGLLAIGPHGTAGIEKHFTPQSTALNFEGFLADLNIIIISEYIVEHVCEQAVAFLKKKTFSSMLLSKPPREVSASTVSGRCFKTLLSPTCFGISMSNVGRTLLLLIQEAQHTCPSPSKSILRTRSVWAAANNECCDDDAHPPKIECCCDEAPGLLVVIARP
jgi:hypothetical protein